MKTMEKIAESKVKIRFNDCDPFNHLNNSKYIDYIINAREDHLISYYDFDIHKVARTGISWVVAQNQIAYITPANPMEVVTIQTQLIYSDEKSLLMEGVMWNEEKTILKAVLWSKFIHIDFKTKKSHIHSIELMNLFKQIENPLTEPVNFEGRIKNLKHSKTIY
jgi:YbgC/YbaW family acyl-CoA thioester hydrolase